MQALAEPLSLPVPLAPVVAVPTAATFWPRVLTGGIVLAPVAALLVLLSGVLAEAWAWPNIAIAAAFYLVISLSVTIGFHRLFTHRSFEAQRPLKITLALLGSMALQGSVIGWVADHRRHHMFTDRDGDLHSPSRLVGQPYARTRGLWHAHLGWLFQHESTSRERFAKDLLTDPDLVVIDRLFLPCSVLTFAIPFGLGYLISGTLTGAIALALWAGVLRIGLFHHVSWSTNSLCHVFGKRPFATDDTSTNFAPLAVLSMGEAWHNAHHAFPASARHGVDRFQPDLSAGVIKTFERLGWATRVRWPNSQRLDARRAPGSR